MISALLETMCWQLAVEEAPTTWQEVARRLGVPLHQVRKWRTGPDLQDTQVQNLLARWNGMAHEHSIDVKNDDSGWEVLVGPPTRGAEVVLLFG